MRKIRELRKERRSKNKVKKERKIEKKKRKISKQDKGITLVALVVTIIILLILAGVTLSGALSENGLFQRAKKAVNEYKKAEEVESKAIEEIGKEIDRITFDYNDYVGAYVTGYTPTTKTEEYPCTIGIDASGHTEAQEFTTEADIKWRIWDYNKSTNTIRLISSKPTNQTLTLKGEKGYNNGVWAINEICRECYTMNEPGISVANLRRTDIQKVSTYDYTQYKHEENSWAEVTGDATGNTIQFGATKTYEENHSYPKMWGDHDQHWTYEYKEGKGTGGDKECASWEKENNGLGELSGTEDGTTDTTFKQSYYAHDYKGKEKEFIKNKYYDLLFKNEDGENYLEKVYWLAGRYVFFYSNYCDFGIQRVETSNGKCMVNGERLWHTGHNYDLSYSLRPIVSIDLTASGYQLVRQEDDDNPVKFSLEKQKIN